jgi:hypothetical protein
MNEDIQLIQLTDTLVEKLRSLSEIVSRSAGKGTSEDLKNGLKGVAEKLAPLGGWPAKAHFAKMR